MLSENYVFFIKIISDFLSGKSTEMPDNVDVSEIVELAHKQQVEGIVFYQLKNQLKNAELMKAYSVCCFYYTNRKLLLEKADKAFNEHGVDYLIFKGTEIAEYYPLPALRSMGDSDILVHNEDKETADKILKELGFTRFGLTESEWHYELNNIEIELHSRLLFDEKVNLEKHKKFSDTAWQYAVRVENCKYRLDINFHLIYLLLHLRKHFINSGVGIRQFADIAVVIKNNDIDFGWIEAELEKLNLTEFSRLCFSFCERWFGVEIPLKSDKITEDFYEASTVRILNNGVFGWSDKSNFDNTQIYKMIQSKNQFLYKLKYISKGLFPSYEIMKEVPRYSFVKRCPPLLPAAWIYRFFVSAFRGSAIDDYNKKSAPVSVSRTDIEKRNNLLSEWGLE